MKAAYCSNCQYKMEANTAIHGQGQPEKGALSICLRCGQLSVFKEDLSLRKITPEELHDLKTNHAEAFLKIMMAKSFINKRTVLN